MPSLTMYSSEFAEDLVEMGMYAQIGKITSSIAISFLLLVAAGRGQECKVTPLPELNAFFERRQGWTGADAAYSIELSAGVILWLYGDTWVGAIADGKHVDATMVNNSIALQYSDSRIEFCYGKTADGKPRAFIPGDDDRWFWIYHGVHTADGLYLFLIEIAKAEGWPGFRTTAVWLAHIANPEDAPGAWRISRRKLPWGRFTPRGDLLFGSAVLRQDEYLYIYGSDEDVVAGSHTKYMVIARVARENLSDFSAWRFRYGGEWRKDAGKLDRQIKGIANEYSVSFDRKLRKYVVVYSEYGMSPNIVVRFADTPHGPWGPAKVVYRCPEAQWDEGIFCYAAKGHAALSRPGELVISYVANCRDFRQLATDTRLYWPRFVKLEWCE